MATATRALSGFPERCDRSRSVFSDSCAPNEAAQAQRSTRAEKVSRWSAALAGARRSDRPLELGDGAEGATLKLTHGLNIPRICDRSSRNRTRQTTVAADFWSLIACCLACRFCICAKSFPRPVPRRPPRASGQPCLHDSSSNRGLRV